MFFYCYNCEISEWSHDHLYEHLEEEIKQDHINYCQCSISPKKLSDRRLSYQQPVQKIVELIVLNQRCLPSVITLILAITNALMKSQSKILGLTQAPRAK